eukprot:s377_g6.t1
MQFVQRCDRPDCCQMAHEAEKTSILVLDDTDITGVAAAWADFVAAGRLVERAPPHELGRYRHGVGEVIPYGASRCSACGSAGADWACGGCGQVRYCDDKCGRIHWSLHRTVCSSRARPSPALAEPSEAMQALPSSLVASRSDGVLLAAKSLFAGDVLCSEPPLAWQPVPAMRASLCARCGATQALLRCAVCQQVNYCTRCRSASSSPCIMCPELSITQGHAGAFTLVGLEILRDWEEGRLQPGDLLKPSGVVMQQARGCSTSVQKVAHFCSAVRWSDERAEEILAAVVAGRIEHTAGGKPVGVGYYPSFARLRAGATPYEKANVSLRILQGSKHAFTIQAVPRDDQPKRAPGAAPTRSRSPEAASVTSTGCSMRCPSEPPVAGYKLPFYVKPHRQLMSASSVAPKLFCYGICCCVLLLLLAALCWKEPPDQDGPQPSHSLSLSHVVLPQDVTLENGLEAALVRSYRSLSEHNSESLPLLLEIQAWMEPSFRALPKVAKGRVGLRGAAHLVHLFFNTNFGINFGLQNGNPFHRDPVKALAEVSLVQTRAPKLSRAMAGLPATYSLPELAAYVAVLQRTELRRVLSSALILLHDWDRVLLQPSTLKQWTDAAIIRRFRLHEQAATQNVESWKQLKKYVAETTRRALPLEERYSFKSAMPAFLELFRTYGSFQNLDCQDMKTVLRGLDETGHGRVSLEAFYSVPEVPNSRFYFREKLDGLGLVDWSLWMPRVVATNYVDGAHNCVAPNPHFSICCIDECGSLLRQMEAGVEAPTSSPEKLLDIAKQLTLRGNLTKELEDRLYEIAHANGKDLSSDSEHRSTSQKYTWNVQEKESFVSSLSALPKQSLHNSNLLAWWSDEESLPLSETASDASLHSMQREILSACVSSGGSCASVLYESVAIFSSCLVLGRSIFLILHVHLPRAEDGWCSTDRAIAYFFSFQFAAQLLIVISGVRDLVLMVQESGGRRRASKKLAEADPKQDQRDGERSKEPTEDKTPAEPVDKGKQVLRAKTGECHDNNTGQELSTKRSRQKGGAEASKQPARKEGYKASKRSKVTPKAMPKEPVKQKGMRQGLNLVPQKAPMSSPRKLDEVENQHFAIAKIFAEIEEADANRPDQEREEESEEVPAGLVTQQAIYEWLHDPQEPKADPHSHTSTDRAGDESETPAKAVDETMAASHPSYPPHPEPASSPRHEKVAVADWLSHPPAELKKAEPDVGDIAPTSPKQISEILLLSLVGLMGLMARGRNKCGAVGSILLLVAGCFPWYAQAEPSPLPGHSISNPPDINHLAKMWHLTGTTMPSHRSLILTPGVADRVGTIFSRLPLKTSDFSAEFTFSAKPGVAGFEEDGFAFWYTTENASDIANDASTKHAHNQDELIAGTWYAPYVKQLGLGTYGYKTQYKGLGVLFGKDAGGKSSVSASYGDGSSFVKADTALQLDFQNGEDHVIQVRVKPHEMVVSVEAKGEKKGTITLSANAKAGGFIGFSCYGGSKDTYYPARERSAFVELKGLKVLNYEDGQGEDSMATIPDVKAPSGDKEDVLGAHSSFRDHRAESEAIKELTNMVFKLVIESKPQREQMKAAIQALSKRAEIDKKTGHNLGEEFEAIKKELADIHAAAHRDTDARGKKLADLHSDIENVHKSAAGGDISGHLDSLSRSNEKMLDQLASQHKRMFGVSIFAIAFIIVAGLSLYNKFRCWEKKHDLEQNDMVFWYGATAERPQNLGPGFRPPPGLEMLGSLGPNAWSHQAQADAFAEKSECVQQMQNGQNGHGSVPQEPMTMPLGASAAGMASPRGSQGMDGVLEQCLETKEQVSNLTAILKLLEGDVDVIRRENLQLRAAMRNRLRSGSLRGDAGSEETGLGPIDSLRSEDVQPVQRPGPERATDGEEADARGYLPGWAAQCPPPVRERERLPKASDKQGQGDDVDAHAHRSGDVHRQGPSSMDLDETSSTCSKKGSPSSSVQASAKSDGRHRQSQMTHVPTEEDALHIPGVPEHDTCPSVWPAFLAASREKREKAEKAEKAERAGKGRSGSGSLGSGSLGSGSLSSGSKEGRRRRQHQGAPGARAAPGAKEKNKRSERPGGQRGGPGSEGSEGRSGRRPSQEEDLDEAAFEAAAAAARQAAEEAAQAAKAAQLQEQVAAQREAQLKDLESQLVAAKRRNEELEAAAALAARREEELAAQAAEMQDLASKLSSTKQRNQELEAAAAAAAKAASKAAKDQAAKAAVDERAREVAEAAATAAWASARESHIAEMRARPMPAQEAESEAVSWAPPATGLPQDGDKAEAEEAEGASRQKEKAKLGSKVLQHKSALPSPSASKRSLSASGAPRAMPYSTFAQTGAGRIPTQAFVPGKRKRLNALAVGFNILLPTVAYAIVFGALAFNVRYETPRLAWSIAALGLLASAASLALGRCSRGLDSQPMWYTFFAASLGLAVVMGAVLGDYTFLSTMEAALDFQNLSSYPAVDPARQKGQQLMDAGRVYFASDSKLDFEKSMSFHDFDEYCVVPIVSGTDTLASYDFWAVGVNCCNGPKQQFRCGEYGNLHARSGLRYLDEGKRQFFRLAVQQAEAAYGIQAKHPLFFTWTQDPLMLVTSKVEAAWRFYYFTVAAHFFTNLSLVLVALLGQVTGDRGATMAEAAGKYRTRLIWARARRMRREMMANSSRALRDIKVFASQMPLPGLTLTGKTRTRIRQVLEKHLSTQNVGRNEQEPPPLRQGVPKGIRQVGPEACVWVQTAEELRCRRVGRPSQTGLQAMVWRPPHVTALSRKHRSCCAHLFILGATALAAIWVMNGVSFVGVPRCKRSERRLAAPASGYIPGVGSLSDDVRNVALQPGSLGMEIDPESGLVKEVFDGAAKKAGVQAGWVFQTVAGKPYELLALKALLRGEEPFEATFGVLKPNPRALLKTSKGTIEVELFLDPQGSGGSLSQAPRQKAHDLLDPSVLSRNIASEFLRPAAFLCLFCKGSWNS